MGFGIREEILSKIKSITEKYNCKFYIFGSRARGDYRKNSDIDVAVEGVQSNEEKMKIRNEFDAIDMEYTIDIVFVESLNNQELIENIRKEGVLI